MYKEIVNPKTQKRVNISSSEGKNIINNYLNYLEGGSATKVRFPLSMGRQEWIDHSTNGRGEQALIDASLRAATEWDAAETQRTRQAPGAIERVMRSTGGTRRRPLSADQQAMQDPQAPQNRQAIATAQLAQPQRRRQPVLSAVQRAMQATATQPRNRRDVATAQLAQPQRIMPAQERAGQPSAGQRSRGRPQGSTRRPRSGTGSQSPRRTSYTALQEHIAVLDQKIDEVQLTQVEILEKLDETPSSSFCSIS